jgi:UDP-N-acetylmuramate dehydrogenase
MTYLTLTNTSLKRFNSIGLNSTAATVYLPLETQGLIEVLKLTAPKKRILIGKGCNILLARDHYDESYAFIVTTLADDLQVHDHELVVEAGLSLNRLAWFAQEQALDGYAFLEDIPGTVGGALIMNAGQFDEEIGPLVHWIEVFDLNDNTVHCIKPTPGFFTYRHSELASHQVVLRAGLKAVPGNEEKNLDKILDIKKKRYLKQPRKYPNAGSVFKRPKKDGQEFYTWKLFDEVGLRGYRIGDAQVSEKHPGFIVNLGHATPNEMTSLVKECMDRVKHHFDITLELEWRVID